MYELLDILTSCFEVFFSGINTIVSWGIAIAAFNYHLVSGCFQGLTVFYHALSNIASLLLNSLENIGNSVVEFIETLFKLVQFLQILARYLVHLLCLILTVSEYALSCIVEWSKQISLTLINAVISNNLDFNLNDLPENVLLRFDKVSAYVHSYLEHVYNSVLYTIYNIYNHALFCVEESDGLSTLPPSCQFLLTQGINLLVVIFLVTVFLTFVHYLHQHNCTFPLLSIFYSRNHDLIEFEELDRDQTWNDYQDNSESDSDLESISSSYDRSTDLEDGDDDDDDFLHPMIPMENEEFELAESSSDEDDSAQIQINIKRRDVQMSPRRSAETIGDNAAALRRRLEEEEEARLCVVCTDAVKSVLVLPCKHVCLCTDCALTIANLPNARRACPLCRTPVTEVLDVFI